MYVLFVEFLYIFVNIRIILVKYNYSSWKINFDIFIIKINIWFWFIGLKLYISIYGIIE